MHPCCICLELHANTMDLQKRLLRTKDVSTRSSPGSRTIRAVVIWSLHECVLWRKKVMTSSIRLQKHRQNGTTGRCSKVTQLKTIVYTFSRIRSHFFATSNGCLLRGWADAYISQRDKLWNDISRSGLLYYSTRDYHDLSGELITSNSSSFNCRVYITDMTQVPPIAPHRAPTDVRPWICFW